MESLPFTTFNMSLPCTPPPPPPPILRDENSLILKYIVMFKLDISINERVTAVQSSENLFSFILRQPCYVHQPILP